MGTCMICELYIYKVQINNTYDVITNKKVARVRDLCLALKHDVYAKLRILSVNARTLCCWLPGMFLHISIVLAINTKKKMISKKSVYHVEIHY